MMKVNKTITPKEINKLTSAYWWGKVIGYCSMFRITQKQLAGVLGVSRQTLTNYKNNPASLTIELLCKFCRAYNIESISALEKF